MMQKPFQLRKHLRLDDLSPEVFPRVLVQHYEHMMKFSQYVFHCFSLIRKFESVIQKAKIRRLELRKKRDLTKKNIQFYFEK